MASYHYEISEDLFLEYAKDAWKTDPKLKIYARKVAILSLVFVVLVTFFLGLAKGEAMPTTFIIMFMIGAIPVYFLFKKLTYWASLGSSRRIAKSFVGHYEIAVEEAGLRTLTPRRQSLWNFQGLHGVDETGRFYKIAAKSGETIIVPKDEEGKARALINDLTTRLQNRGDASIAIPASAIRYRLNDDEIARTIDYLYLATKKTTRDKNRLGLGLLILVFCLLYWLLRATASFSEALTGLIFFGLMLVLLYVSFSRLTKTRLRERAHMLQGRECALLFDDQKIWMRGPQGETTSAWSEIFNIEETQQDWVLYHAPQSLVVIPKRVVAKPELQQVLRQVTEQFQRGRAD